MIGRRFPHISLSWLDRPLRHLRRGWAMAFAVALLAALGWSAIALPQSLSPHPSSSKPATRSGPVGDGGDFALYARIAARVAEGHTYYTSALDEQRKGGYPTRPFITVRLPTLAWIDAAIGAKGAGIMAIALLFTAILAWQRSLARRPAAERIGATVLIFLGGMAAFEPRAGLSHELIAGLLVALALALKDTRPWPLALLALAVALAVRELALPFALLWLALSAAERRWREVAALVVLIALFGLALWLHSLGVAAEQLPGDRASPGWSGFQGPAFVLGSIVRFTPLIALPASLAGPLALLPLLGWAAAGGRLGGFAFLWFAGFALVMAVLARADNFYWALIMLPAYSAGLAFVPRAIRDLFAAMRGTAIA